MLLNHLPISFSAEEFIGFSIPYESAENLRLLRKQLAPTHFCCLLTTRNASHLKDARHPPRPAGTGPDFVRPMTAGMPLAKAWRWRGRNGDLRLPTRRTGRKLGDGPPSGIAPKVAGLLKPKRNRTPARKRILLVDDHADLLAAWALFFKSRAFDVACASDGLEALARIEEQLPDLVITDHLMPWLTGLQLCAHLRARPETRIFRSYCTQASVRPHQVAVRQCDLEDLAFG